jgi:hypothetical protein
VGPAGADSATPPTDNRGAPGGGIGNGDECLLAPFFEHCAAEVTSCNPTLASVSAHKTFLIVFFPFGFTALRGDNGLVAIRLPGMSRVPEPFAGRMVPRPRRFLGLARDARPPSPSNRFAPSAAIYISAAIVTATFESNFCTRPDVQYLACWITLTGLRHDTLEDRCVSELGAVAVVRPTHLVPSRRYAQTQGLPREI